MNLPPVTKMTFPAKDGMSFSGLKFVISDIVVKVVLKTEKRIDHKVREEQKEMRVENEER